MAEEEVGFIIITKGNGSSKTQKQKQPYGIITKRDLVRRLAKNKDMYFQDAIVESICSHPLIVGYPGMTVQEAVFDDSVPVILVKATKPVSKVALNLSVMGFKAVPITVEALHLLIITSSIQCTADIQFLYK